MNSKNKSIVQSSLSNSGLLPINDSTLLRTNEFRKILPQSFNFYSLGQVVLQQSPGRITDQTGKTEILYIIEGDTKIFMTLLLDSTLDLSIYSEMGNIIAARVASTLEQNSNTDWMITPPVCIQSNEITKTPQPIDFSQLYEYHHLIDLETIAFQVLITLSHQREAGNA